MKITAIYNLKFSIIFAIIFGTYTFSQSINDRQSECGVNIIYHYYVNETANNSKMIFSLEKFNIDENAFHLFFYSEVKDNFEITIDGQFYKRDSINTETLIEEDGLIKIYPYRLDIIFPQNKNSFVLKVDSVRYGCFETVVYKEYPMLYVKYFKNSWYLTHSNAFRFSGLYFTRIRGAAKRLIEIGTSRDTLYSPRPTPKKLDSSISN
ncbi:hypothetical protein ACXGQW_07840 [Wenyingzhuangia sp. IMCC45533]